MYSSTAEMLILLSYFHTSIVNYRKCRKTENATLQLKCYKTAHMTGQHSEIKS